MGRVREFQVEDTGQVADLWMKVFRRSETPGSEALRNYLAEIFIEGRGAGPAISSLVYEENGGAIVGFLGILSRRLAWKGQPVSAAVSSQFMIDTSRHRGSAALELMKTFLSGPQELSFTDGASEGARILWEAMRGELVTLYSSVWVRILRPASYLLDVASSRPKLRAAAKLCRPFASLADRGGKLAPPYAVPATAATTATDADVDTLLKCIAGLPAKWRLRPLYDRETLSSLLRQAGEAGTRGRLTSRIVRDSRGEPLGWYIYYSKPSGVSKVLQLGGKEREIEHVLHHLFEDASRGGSIAVSGRLEPRFSRQLSRNHCSFDFPDIYFLAHSRNTELLDVLHRGSAFLTRLEGEWWLRFQEERWEAREPSGERATRSNTSKKRITTIDDTTG